MSRGLARPTAPASISDLLRRVTALERVLGDPRDRSGPPEVIFSLTDLIPEESGTWVCRTGRTSVYELVTSLLTAGTTDTVVEVHVNGATVATITLDAGVDSITTAINLTLGVNDRVSCELTAAGSGAVGLVVQARLRYPR